MKLRKVLFPLLCMILSTLVVCPVMASVKWGERIKITEEDTVVDSITYNGVTVDAYYGPISSITQEVYDGGRYSCSAFVRRFYKETMGLTLSLGFSSVSEPGASEGVFVKTETPVPGDLITKNSGSHYAIVKEVYGDTIVTIEQNLWADREKDIAFKGRSLTNESAFTYWHWTKYANEESVREFVTRLYRLCLGREPDPSGFENWVSRLLSRSITAARAVQGFFFSKEMNNMGLSDEDFVERCYAVMMDRGSDAGGKAGWVEKLTAGVSRNGIVKGFVESPEFTKLCKYFTIERGTITAQWRDKNAGVTAYVIRLYQYILQRTYDAGGLNGWCRKILTGQFTARQAAVTGFFHSTEFFRRQLDDEAFIKILYPTFLDREYDESGLAYWLEKIQDGYSRDRCIAGFADSSEFRNLMARYGFTE